MWISRGMCVCSGMYMCQPVQACTRALLCAMCTDEPMLLLCCCALCSAGGGVGGGGGGGESLTLIHELVDVEQRRAEQLRVSVLLSGRGRVRGCGWVTLCGRGAASADMTAFARRWGEGRSDGGKKKEGKQKQIGPPARWRKHVVFI